MIMVMYASEDHIGYDETLKVHFFYIGLLGAIIISIVLVKFGLVNE